MSIRFQPVAVAVVAATAGGVAGAGGGLMSLLRRRSITATLIGTTVTAVLAVFVGVFVATEVTPVGAVVAHLMWAATAAAGAVGVAVALLFGWSISSGARKLEDCIRRLGDGAPLDAPGLATTELSGLAVELVRTNQRIAEARARQKALEDSRRELVAWMSHDLRTPLSALQAMAAALEDRVVADEDTMARYHAGIRNEADRLAGMIDDLFVLSRIHAGTVLSRLELQALAELVSDAVAALQPVAEARRVRLAARSEDGLFVHADDVAFGRALRNLLTNAIEYTPPGGSVELSAARDGDRVRIEVADECGGIADADLPRLFDPGYRGGADAMARAPGAGLGLTIVAGIASAHGGSVEARNENGGCRFILDLPSAPPPE